MSTLISRDFTFPAAVHYDNSFIMNTYHMGLDMILLTDNIRHQNIAMERVKYYLYTAVSNCVFIHQDENIAINNYINANIKVCTLPEKPFEQIIGIALLLKLNNLITSDKIEVIDVSISSRLSDDVLIHHHFDDPIGPFSADGWWKNKKICINDITCKEVNGNIVELITPAVEWGELGLEYESRDKKSKIDNSTVVYLKNNKKSFT